MNRNAFGKWTIPMWTALFLATVASHAHAAPLEPRNIGLTPIGSYASGIFDEAGAEIVAHDPVTQRLYVVNAQAASVDVLSIADPTLPTKIGTINLAILGGVANSVAVRDGVVAIALEAFTKTDPGLVVFFGDDLSPLKAVTVGALPDMLTFTPNGRYLLVANEGEPNTYNDYGSETNGPSIDPEGSVSIIDLSSGVAQATVRTAGFHHVGDKATLQAAGIRIFGPNASVAQDLEPEYIAVSADSRTAWVTLQENNAMATIDISTGEVTELIALGLKNHDLTENGFGSSNALDASDRDNEAGTGPAIKLANHPVKGMYQSDAIAAYSFQGETFLVMANEGDVREYPGLNGDVASAAEDIRVGNAGYLLDPVAFPAAIATELKQNRNLGRLQASRFSGDLNGDGKFDEIHIFGGRSFSIRKTSGELVFDSGSQFEEVTATIYPMNFNASSVNTNLDSRSASKGPEPESVELGRAFGRMWAFIGLERIGGVMVYDVTDPYGARFVNYVNNRNLAVAPGPASIPPAFTNTGDLAPEGLLFISEENSPNGKPLLVVANEVSGTTTIFEIARE
jgi:DNA-binding beta-propeller fold protein YncE